MKDVTLFWQSYRLFPYEKVLGRREVEALLQPIEIVEDRGSLTAKGCRRPELAEDLVYFSAYAIDGVTAYTRQYEREGTTSKKQNTRYFSHGIHEYKGKFNPQIVRAIMNICQCNRGVQIIDPFCGSGTSLLEAELQGIRAYGVDVNPMATFIANIKTHAIFSREKIIQFDIDKFADEVKHSAENIVLSDDARTNYLRKWFRQDYLPYIEAWKREAENQEDKTLRGLLLLALSNILREYSEQEPSDLRIRRRNTPYPTIPMEEAAQNSFLKSQSCINQFLAKVDAESLHEPQIINRNIKDIQADMLPKFDLAVTSPPYATALPYIDTQRLSIVWLGLDIPGNIRGLECSLIGSRELMSKGERDKLFSCMSHNTDNLSSTTISLCKELQMALTPADGFRKQYTPLLLYKYFAEMAQMFENVYRLLREGGYYCLVVGYNKTTIGGYKIIDTPRLLAEEAKAKGFLLQEIIPLETYQRYGLHAQQAITSEALIILRTA
ncbi:MAG: hypothetical protein IJ064_03380 [Bacteroidaceae bacterium]|nr:hypothetical protein [Bacteroidaceae bacterium]